MIARNVKLVEIGKRVLIDNDLAAEGIRRQLDDAGVLAINVIAGPGAGKTSFISRTLQQLAGRARVGVIEGDISGSVDTAKVLEAGASDAVQINTGGNCHLEANMVEEALSDLDLTALDLLFIENVGNLVCPTHWELGEHLKLCLVGASEGDDKPIKYPEIFAVSDVVVLNKIDLADYVDFNRESFMASVRALNQRAQIFEISCRTGEGLEAWTEWLLKRRSREEQDPLCVSH
ncbi:MAG: hydrogenase nickel incorporation protein HypB [Nitrolancea sp.]